MERGGFSCGDIPCPGERILVVATESLEGAGKALSSVGLGLRHFPLPPRALVILGACKLRTTLCLYPTLSSTAGKIGNLGQALNDTQ